MPWLLQTRVYTRAAVFALLVLSFLVPNGLAQTPTLVSGTITDPNGIPYSNAKVSATLVGIPPSQTATVLVNGNPTQIGGQQNAAADANGSFTMNLFCNSAGGGCSVISPAATQWQFTVQTNGEPLPLGTGPQSCVALITITGASQSVTANLSACPALGRGGSSSSSPVNSQFFISNVNCSLASNCLQMVDDDSTDNCGAALTAWLAVVNGYNGPGRAQVSIYGSGPGKAYKFATLNCELAFINTLGANVHVWATLDFAQSGRNGIRLGPTGQAAAVIGEDFSLDGTGVIFGGASLTTGCAPACAGVLVMPGVNNVYIEDIQFAGPLGGTSNSGFGANNATLGNCTNYLLYIANPVSTGLVRHTKGGVTSSSNTVGGCGYANPNGSAAGTNTVKFLDNIIGTIGFAGGIGACGSIGILDGGSYGTNGDNVIYGFGMLIRAQGQGHIIRHNELDNAQCTAFGLQAAINVGASGSGAAVPGMNVDGNIIQGGSNHSIDLLAIAGDSTATITGASLTNNQTSGASTANLTHTNTSCTPNVSQGNQCWISGNINMNNTISAGNAGGIGWSNGLALAGQNSQSGLGANLAGTVLVRAPTTRTYLAWCEVIETTRDAVSATLPSCQFTYTDAVSGVAVTRTVTQTSTANLVGTISDGVITMVVTGGTDIGYQTTGYLSNTASAMKYTVGGFIATY